MLCRNLIVNVLTVPYILWFCTLLCQRWGF